jgi:hypothetical protein
MTRPRLPLLAFVMVTLLWALPIAPVSAADASPHPRAALVIGNTSYTTMNPVTSAANDEHDMCDALTALGYSASCFADVKDAKEFKARIQDFTASLRPKSEVVFYYAGHAIHVRGENYLVPTTAGSRTEVDVPKETISLAYIMTQLLQGKHYLNIVILDACRGTPWQGSAHGMTAGLAPITAIPHGTMVMYATAPNDYAEPSGARNGVLTKHLLANIASPGFTADEFFKKVSEGVQTDLGDAASVESAALYTNFTGEFCFGGCIDKVARAELEKLEKENEEQLEQARKQRAELEARNREARAKLLEAAISSNCDNSVLGDTDRCFIATPETVTKAVATAFTQRGFMRFMRPDIDASSGAGTDSWWVSTDRASEEALWAARITDNATDKNVSDIVRISATLRNVTSIGRCVVSLNATRRTVLHDEFHTWGSISIVPVATSKQYRDVVKNEVDITDPALYQDLLAAIERNVRGINAGTAEGGAVAAAPTAKEAVQLSDHEQRYDAPPDRTQRALIAALVSQGYLIRSLHPEFGSIDLYRRIQDPKDKHQSIDSTLTASVTTSESGAGSQAQLSGDEAIVAYIEPGGKMMGALSGDNHARHDLYETRLVHESAVTDAGFYRGLFAAAEASLRSEPMPPSKHSRRVALSADQILSKAAETLPQHGYEVTRRDDRLGIVQISKRTAIPLNGNDGWTAHYMEATVYVDAGAASESVLYVAANSQDRIFQAARTVSYSFLLGARYHSSAARDCRAKKCTIDELEVRFAGSVGEARRLESLTHEGDADAAAYSEIFSIVSQQPAKAGR